MDAQQIPADKNFADKNINIANIEDKINKIPRKIMIVAAVVLLIGLMAGGYYGWKILKGAEILFNGEEIIEIIGDTVKKLTESTPKDELPSIQINPLKNRPDLNPADKAKPFKDIKINP